MAHSAAKLACLLGALYSAALLAAPPSQERIAREMIQVLEAYAVYKMGNFDEAFERYQALAEAGNHQGMLNLGNMYAAGLGTEEDVSQALRWYRQAAEGGDAIGLYEVGRAYDKGLGVTADTQQALAWYRRAAELDNGTAQWALGLQLYQRGEVLEGLRWIRAAAPSEPAAARFLSTLAQTPQQAPQAAFIARVQAALRDVDAAARAGDSPQMLGWLDDASVIRVRMPDSAHWTSLNKAQLNALWQATFRRADAYRYQRSEPQVLEVNGEVLVFSEIEEQLEQAGRTQQLRLSESLHLLVSSTGLRVKALHLDIRRVSATDD